jgi:hypothetical protein
VLRTCWRSGMPAMDLKAECVRIRKIIPVSECRKPVGPTDGVDLGMRFLLDFGMEGHGEVERVDRGDRL